MKSKLFLLALLALPLLSSRAVAPTENPADELVALFNNQVDLNIKIGITNWILIFQRGIENAKAAGDTQDETNCRNAYYFLLGEKYGLESAKQILGDYRDVQKKTE